MQETVKNEIDRVKKTNEWQKMSQSEKEATMAILIGFSEGYEEAKKDLANLSRWS